MLIRVLRGETYPIVGRNADSTWYQINVNGRYGWVFALLVNATNTSSEPVMDASSRDGGWYQISYNGIVGWVSSRFVTPQPGTDCLLINRR